MTEILPVSIIIPTYNRVQKLFKLLKSIKMLTPLPNEVIIIDDNSTDGSKKILSKWKGISSRYDKRIILKNNNKGPADSRNRGIKVSKNELIAFTDDDVILDKHWLKYITSKFQNIPDKLAGVGGSVRSLRGDILSQYYIEHKILEAPLSLNYLPTVNCCLKKSALLEIGGFNTSFSFAGGEDTDICLRLRNLGYFFLKERKAVVYHDFSSNFLDFCKMWIRYGKGTQMAISNNQRL